MEPSRDNQNAPQSPASNAGDLPLQQMANAVRNQPNGLTDDDLAQQELRGKFKEGEKAEKYGDHTYRIVVILMYVMGAILLALGVVWVLHTLLPDDKRWLSQQEVQGIERLLFSSIIVSVAGRYFKKFKIIDKD